MSLKGAEPARAQGTNATRHNKRVSGAPPWWTAYILAVGAMLLAGRIVDNTVVGAGLAAFLALRVLVFWGQYSKGDPLEHPEPGNAIAQIVKTCTGKRTPPVAEDEGKGCRGS